MEKGAGEERNARGAWTTPARIAPIMSKVRNLPTATYRWQFHAGFRFVDAIALVPYLAELGISHCYASPYLKAHPGSVHGYDISDHNAINPEIGTDKERQQWVQALHAHGLGQIIDIVPNHMTVNDPNNHWWWDVLEYGEHSRYAHFFDIDWRTPDREYDGKVVLPILGDQYGRTLESGDIRLHFDQVRGMFTVQYYEHILPVGPGSYSRILTRLVEYFSAGEDADSKGRRELLNLIQVFNDQGERVGVDPGVRDGRRTVAQARGELAEFFGKRASGRLALRETLAFFNGALGQGAGRFDPLHVLLEEQAYRLAYWRVSGCDINYRRFFDINDLAALRVENADVFEASHALVGSWVASGDVDGLRIDHPDGLRDPGQYFTRINDWARRLRPKGDAVMTPEERDGLYDLPLYLVVEKILGTRESLPKTWRVHGTTGYDFANLVNGVLIDGRSEEIFDRTYEEFVEACDHYADMLYECKKLIMHTSLGSEIHSLGIRLWHIAEMDRQTRDFTHPAQMAAIFEIVACFPVYRTYVTEHEVGLNDRCYIEAACATAKARNPLVDSDVVDFIQSVLLLEGLKDQTADYRRDVLDCVAAFQQYTGPVMAKGLEDTLFYRYNRFVSLNEVGGDASRFAVSIEAFHEGNQVRLHEWPYTMLCTTSHDTKRSEDVRARLNVLSEIPGAWGERVLGFKERHRHLKEAPERAAPSPRDEYLFYQSLVGIWPLGPLQGTVLADVHARISAYMQKAVREAKAETNWETPSLSYEAALAAFIDGVLDPVANADFITEWAAWIAPIAYVGLWNSLSQVALKLLVPGVPDFYQGTEVWDFSLVDPDNRRPVDYLHRAALMADIVRHDGDGLDARVAFIRALVATPEDGRVKMYLTRVLLQLRRSESTLLAWGEYLPLIVTGTQGRHLISFARRLRDRVVIVAVSRCYWDLTKGGTCPPLGADVWGDTTIGGLPLTGNGRFRNLFTGEHVGVREKDGAALWAADLFREFPIAVLVMP